MNQSTNWDVVVVGSANTDYTVRGQHLPKPGETVVGEQLVGQLTERLNSNTNDLEPAASERAENRKKSPPPALSNALRR